MTKPEKLNSLKTILVEYETVTNLASVKRKELINDAIRNGLVEKDTYVVLKPSSKSSTKGHYAVAEMLKLVEAAMNKGAPAKKAKAKKAITVKRSIEQEIAEEVRGTEDESGDVLCFGELEYGYGDIEEELSIMGTSL